MSFARVPPRSYCPPHLLQVFTVTAFASVFAYMWLYFVLAVWTPDYVTVTEGACAPHGALNLARRVPTPHSPLPPPPSPDHPPPGLITFFFFPTLLGVAYMADRKVLCFAGKVLALKIACHTHTSVTHIPISTHPPAT